MKFLARKEGRLGLSVLCSVLLFGALIFANLSLQDLAKLVCGLLCVISVQLTCLQEFYLHESGYDDE